MERSSDNDDDEGDPSLSVDAILDFLSHHHRRALLRTLCDAAENTVSEDEMISRLQKQEERRTGEQPSWEHISATLHHVHEPKLSEAGLITYDEREGTYEYHPHDQVEQWLDHIESLHESGCSARLRD